MEKWKNKQTGDAFSLLAHGVNQTHGKRSEVVIYSPEENQHMVCVMDSEEFFREFKNDSPAMPGTESEALTVLNTNGDK